MSTSAEKQAIDDLDVLRVALIQEIHAEISYRIDILCEQLNIAFEDYGELGGHQIEPTDRVSKIRAIQAKLNTASQRATNTSPDKTQVCQRQQSGVQPLPGAVTQNKNISLDKVDQWIQDADKHINNLKESENDTTENLRSAYSVKDAIAKLNPS